jgi:hypothetical protein
MIATIIIDIEAPMLTKPSIKLLLISTRRCNVLLRWYLLMLILHMACDLSTLVWLTVFKPSSHYFLTNSAKVSNDFSSPSITNIVSIGDTEIFPLMK